MDLRIGTTSDQRIVVFDTRRSRPLVLVGDPAHGKTTSTRTERPHPPVGAKCAAGTCILIVEDVDHAASAALALLPIGSAPGAVTSRGGGLEALEILGDGYTRLGLVRRRDPRLDSVADGQGRPDWPVETTPVVADQPGPADLPAQRWHLHPGEKAGRRRAGSGGSPAVVAGVAR